MPGQIDFATAVLVGTMPTESMPGHTHPQADVTSLTSDLASKQATNEKNAASGYAGLNSSSKLTGSQQVYGTSANTSAEGNDSRLSDARTPTAHTHPAADIASGTVATARLGSGTADGTTFLRGDQTWAIPAGGGGGGLTLTEIEKDLGSIPLYSGTFDIIGLSGLTANKQVLIQQKAAPYTGKGDLYDEMEMDQVQVGGYVMDATTVRAFWTCQPKSGPMAGNVKFGYQVAA